MRLVWTLPAHKDREKIIFYIAENNIDAAINMDIYFDKAADSLLLTPAKGRIGRMKGTRELIVHRNYILVYGYDKVKNTIVILAVLHTSRQYPPLE